MLRKDLWERGKVWDYNFIGAISLILKMALSNYVFRIGKNCSQSCGQASKCIEHQWHCTSMVNLRPRERHDDKWLDATPLQHMHISGLNLPFTSLNINSCWYSLRNCVERDSSKKREYTLLMSSTSTSVPCKTKCQNTKL